MKVVSAFLVTLVVSASAFELGNSRPAPSQRTFNSSAIEKVIADFTAKLKDPDLATLFTNCFPNTLGNYGKRTELLD
jgi:hypothetical protein